MSANLRILLYGSIFDIRYTAETNIMGGGDGGCTICGGVGFFIGWLIASAFVDPYYFKENLKEIYGNHLRRAYSLPE